jgi:YD repeat-containing protein
MHDNTNYSSTFVYRANVTVQTTPSGHTCTLYDMLGNPWFTQSPHTPATAVATSSSGSNFSMPSAITTNGDSLSTVSLNYDALFLPTSFMGPNTAVASAIHDSFGRVTSSTSTDGALTNYTYSTGAPPMTQLAVTGIPGQSGFSNTTWTQTTLDGLGRAIKVQFGPGNTPGNAVTETDTVYGPCACSPTGKMIQVSQPFTPGGSQYWTTYTYDAIGRTTFVESPDGGSITGYVYQANTVTVHDPTNKIRTTTSDVQGNVTAVTEPDPVNNGQSIYTYYTYDTMEHLTQVSMTRGSITQTRTFNYDPGTHLLTSETHPETGTTYYTYTADSFTNDLLTTKTDYKGQVTQYKYDPNTYRLIAIKRYTSQSNFSAGLDDPCQRVNYTYDLYTNANVGFFGGNQWGHVAAVSTGDTTCWVIPGQVQQQFTTLYSYWPSGHVTQKRLQLVESDVNNPTNYTAWWDVFYNYNVFGQVTSVQYPNSGNSTGLKYSTGFDSMQRPNSLSDNYGNTARSIVLSVQYNAANQPTQTQFEYPGTSSTFWEYRGYNQLNQLTTLNNLNSGVNLAYTYSPNQNNGQITGMTDVALGQTVSYSYDALKRLTTATAMQGSTTAWTQSYAYDGFGNITQKATNNVPLVFGVDATTNRLAGGNFCYDPNGNMISDQNGGGCGNPNYTYDVANRLVSAKVSGGTETYGYDANNKRISKISSSGAQTIYVYGAMGEKLAVASTMYGTAGQSNSGVYGGNAGPSTLLSMNNIYFNGHLISQGVDGRGYSFNFVGTDRLGSVRVSAPFGGPNVSASYLPSGEELNPRPTIRSSSLLIRGMVLRDSTMPINGFIPLSLGGS